MRRFLITFFFVGIITLTACNEETQNEESSSSADTSNANEVIIEPMQLTEKESDILDGMGENALGFDLTVPADVQGFTLNYRIEHYYEGVKQQDVIDASITSRAENPIESFILNEITVFDPTDASRMGYVYHGITLNEMGHGGRQHSFYPFHRVNSLNQSDELRSKTTAELNEEVTIATRVEDKDDNIEHRGVFDESSSEYEMMIQDNTDVFIFKLQIESDSQ
ncbi:hypothetical protein MM300_19880 [Evansella sp. LMS18]|uniref:hypothetical protein n=1 Tax=Evansella sp. LMS18 TaxID=2924033 RepID=UPI0020D080F7|nr:hypothetical protein [Evansella sp. LMS18]UTR10111.1 hypothetical protein MM300_19880 [Evansella sp. LMS18]